jgi:prepilin signal peptidase PulO-like enzyme (type II secretory pathway)
MLLPALVFFLFGAYGLWYAATKIILKEIPLTYSPHAALFLRMFVGALCIVFSVYCPTRYFLAYSLFFTASCLVIYTDTLSMLIARITTLYFVPLVWFLAFYNFLEIGLLESMGGTLLGVAVLGITRQLSISYYQQPGLGIGDIDYIALAGATTGILGVWLTILLGSFLASVWAISMMLYGSFSRTTLFPFGTFLSLAGILVLLFKDTIASLLM